MFTGLSDQQGKFCQKFQLGIKETGCDIARNSKLVGKKWERERENYTFAHTNENTTAVYDILW